MNLQVNHTQAGFEQYCRDYFDWVYAEQPDTVNVLFRPVVAGCSYEDMWMQVDVTVDRWMVNPLGNMHGGMIAAAMDMVMGLVTRFAGGGSMTPTVDMTTHYLCSVPAGAVLHVRAKCLSVTPLVCHTVCRCWVGEDESHPSATASGSYFRSPKDVIAE